VAIPKVQVAILAIFLMLSLTDGWFRNRTHDAHPFLTAAVVTFLVPFMLFNQLIVAKAIMKMKDLLQLYAKFVQLRLEISYTNRNKYEVIYYDWY
jgi:hypothetical protein